VNPAKEAYMNTNAMSEEERIRFEQFMRNRVSEEAVARVLGCVAALPNRREAPLVDDPKGDFDFWFDGGTCRMITGYNEFRFQDGTIAHVVVSPLLAVEISFPDGRRVRVHQQDSQPLQR
jgi:hypothetical protein